MTFKDVDLRDALAPLAGDPVEDAARVLKAMPAPGIPPVAWWLLGVGLAAGVLCGIWLSGDDPAPPAKDPEVVGRKEPQVEKPPPEKKDAWAEMDHMKFYGLGKVRVTEPGKATVDLAGSWQVELATRFETGYAMAGMLLDGDVQVRLDCNTTAVLAPEERVRRILLDAGRLYVVSGYEQEAPVVVTTPAGFVDVVNGRAMVEFREQRLTVISLDGEVSTHAKTGKPIKVPPGSLVSIDADGAWSEPEPVEWMAAHTSWMVQLIVRQEDQRELDKRVREMVGEYFGERFRREAKRELLKLGASAVGPLVEQLGKRVDMPVEFQRETARLLCRMANSDAAPQLFQLLHSRDPEVRVTVYGRLVELTDDGQEYGDRFWRREDNAEERNRVIWEWWDRSRR